MTDVASTSQIVLLGEDHEPPTQETLKQENHRLVYLNTQLMLELARVRRELAGLREAVGFD